MKIKNNFFNIFIFVIIFFIILIIIILFNYLIYLEKFANYQTNDDNIKTDIDPNDDYNIKMTNVNNEASTDGVEDTDDADDAEDAEDAEDADDNKKSKPPMKFDNQYSKNSFCQLDDSKTKCVCKFQKDDIKAAFNSPIVNCDKICSSIKPEDCLENNEFTEKPYFCNIAGKCVEYKGTVVSSHISANNCGTEPLTNQLLLPYASLEECNRTLDPCDIYNNPNNSIHLNRTNCLGNPNCGFCTNSSGEGKCISGHASGPSDLNKYYYCNPYNGNKNNTYEYGNRTAYILQN